MSRSSGRNDYGDRSEPSNYSVHQSYGGYNNFMHSHGLKPWDDDDVQEGKTIVQALKEHDDSSEHEDEGSHQSVYDSFGGYDNFMHSYGLHPYDDDDVEEGRLIAEALEEMDGSGSEGSQQDQHGYESGEHYVEEYVASVSGHSGGSEVEDVYGVTSGSGDGGSASEGYDDHSDEGGYDDDYYSDAGYDDEDYSDHD